MRFSVFTASTPQWTPAEAAAALAAQGWDGIEWRVTDQQPAAEPGFWAGNRATWPLTGLERHLDEIARVTRDAGLAYSGIGGYARAFDHENVERMLAATSVLGAHRVRVTMPELGTGPYRELFTATRADLEWVASRAAHHGVQALIEMHHRTITSSASAAYRMLEGLDPEHIGVIHDSGNVVFEGHEDYLAGFELLGEYLAHVHVKNVAWHPTGERRADGSAVWRADWATLRDGQVDVDDYFAALATVGYDRWVTLEDFSTELPLAQRTADNLAFVKAAHERAVAANGR
ncbi:sugar phosphate isomerase/epimerase family protein [Humibacter ginsenosidimutans]|uniref:Sugar phosphate isomerase/epimerase n=1 Tax=Humibacter ginsenosidimutans TaxID=2599293 RepID=A0A5B8M0W4_9MICO|nr:sugar phosphate isomerase/epimerase family protein [Humibacter ginsenosidimutans]QDZ14458.1 sugar phosphate isomerase/epimerase [Humibacter ginsenosidimutans]